MPFVEAGGHRLEYEWLGPAPDTAPTIVMLHEGLGSVAMWRDFPAAVRERTGLGVCVYSRWGYGRSDPCRELPQPVDYLHRHARVDVPDLLCRLGITRPILLGHSDGASIEPAPLGVIALAPHVFVEQVTTNGIARARVAFEAEGLRQVLAKYHDDVDSAFFTWNLAWLLPAFIRDWNLESQVEAMRCPLTVIQGTDDEYGSARQYEAIAARYPGEADVVVLSDCGHSPHRDRRDATLDAIARHVANLKVAA
jgi:pimeloyl-ACP methyl ester carboxylesterase